MEKKSTREADDVIWKPSAAKTVAGDGHDQNIPDIVAVGHGHWRHRVDTEGQPREHQKLVDKVFNDDK